MFSEDTLDLRLLLSKLTAKWYYFFISFMLALALAFVYLRIADRIYLVEATVLLNSQQGNSWRDREQFIEGLEYFLPNNNIEDEIGLITSSKMVRSALEHLDIELSYFVKDDFKYYELYPAFPFEIKLDSISDQIVNVPIYINLVNNQTYLLSVESEEVTSHNLVTRATHAKKFGTVNINETVEIGSHYKDQFLSFTLNLNENSGNFLGKDMYFVIHDINKLTEDFQSKLSVNPKSTDSRIIQIGTRGEVIAKEINFINALVKVFLDEELRKKTEVGLRTINFLDEQLASISDSLQRAESTLETFRSRNNIIDISTTSENLAFRMDKMEEDRAIVRDQLDYYNYVLTYLRSNSEVTKISLPSSRGIDDPILHGILEQLTELSQQKAGLGSSTRANNPAVDNLNRRITEVSNSLIENVSNTINTTTNSLRNIQARIASVQNEISRLPQNERRLVSIQRKFQFSDNIYNYLLEKRAEAGIAIAANMPSRAVIDEAKMVGRKPVSPKKTLVLVLALMFGFGVPIALILILDFFNDRVRSADDIKEISSFPVISSIPFSKEKTQLGSMNWRRSLLAESLNTTRINLRYIATGQNKIVIAISSGVPTEGKTFCAINLATSLAQSGKKAILIDGDLRKPRINEVLGIGNNVGLSSYLINEIPLIETIKHTDQKNMDVITAGPCPPNPMELLELPRLESMVSTLKEKYEYIIFDTPPSLLVSDFFVISNQADIKIFIVRQNFTKKQILQQLVENVESKEIKGVGIILNGADYKSEYGYVYYDAGKDSSKWKKLLTSKSSFLLTFLSLLLLNVSSINAATYYVSNLGNDVQSGIEPSSAWRTLEKVSSSSTIFAPGDSILFERGHTFYGQLHLTTSGTRMAPIYIGAFGAGEKPVIKGTGPINGWKKLRDNVWEAKCTSCKSEVTNLFIDGIPQPLARYPNDHYLNWTKVKGSDQIVDQSLNFADDYWTNAFAVVRSSRWTLDRLTVADHSENTLRFSRPASYPLKDNWGYFIQNHPNALDIDGEWCFDSLTSSIKIFLDAPPESTEVSLHQYGLKLSGTHNIVIDELQFVGQAGTGLSASNCNYLQLRNSVIRFSGINGIELDRCNYYVIENNRFTDINNNGCIIKGSFGGIFQSNLLKRIGIKEGRGLSGNGQYNGLVIRSFGRGGHMVTDNVIDSIGYIGIDFRSEGTSITKNFIANFCMVKDDGAGIYTYNNRNQGNIIKGNLIVNGIGAVQGIPNPTRPMAEGIYLDDGTSNLLVSDNKVLACSKGIYIHNSNNLEIENNVLLDNLSQVTIKYDDVQGIPHNSVNNCLISNNILLGLENQQWSLILNSIDEDISKLATFNKNYINHTLKERPITIEIRDPKNHSKTISERMSVPDWQNQFHSVARDNTDHSLLATTQVMTWDAPISAYSDEINSWQKRINEILGGH